MNSFQSNLKKTWESVGDPPYLDIKNESYIHTNKKLITGFFGFQNSTVNSGEIKNASMFFLCYAEDAPENDGFDVFLYNGSWYNMGHISPSHNKWGHIEHLNVSTLLTNWNKINTAKTYLSYSKVGKGNNVFVGSVYLHVDYVPEPFPGMWFYSDADDLSLKTKLVNPTTNPVNCLLNKYEPHLMVNLKLVKRGPEYLKIIIIVENKNEVVYQEEDYLVMDVGDEVNRTYILPLHFLRTSSYNIDVFIFRLHKEPLRTSISHLQPPPLCILFRFIFVCLVLIALFYLIYKSNP